MGLSVQIASRIRGPLLVAAFLAFTPGCTWLRFLRTYHQPIGLSAHLARETGPGAVDCGVFSFPVLMERRLTAQQEVEVSACMRSAHQEGKPFFFVLKGPSIDSQIGEGLLATPSGQVNSFWFDSAPCGGHCGDRFTLQPCVVGAGDSLDPGMRCGEPKS